MDWKTNRIELQQRLQTIDLSNQEDYIFRLFQYQYRNNPIYQRFVNLIKGQGFQPQSLEEIPFLPISFFKDVRIVTGKLTDPVKTFQSSGTTQSSPSLHYVFDLAAYLEHTLRIFEMQYGAIENFHILALLPGYQERANSSLIEMIDNMISNSKSEISGYYLGKEEELLDILQQQRSNESEKTILLFGVSFALLQLFEDQKLRLKNVIIMETGGMKGKGPEWTKEQLHDYLSQRSGISHIQTEYGMTELLSQSYGIGNYLEPNLYLVPSISDITDPFTLKRIGESGLLRFIDLANIDSCAFIQTEDLGVIHENRTFSILGRLDHAEIRGCNLLVSDLK